MPQYRRSNLKSMPVVLGLTHAENVRLMETLDLASSRGLDPTGIADRIRFAWDASDFAEVDSDRLVPCGTGMHPATHPLTREQLGGDPAAAIAEGVCGGGGVYVPLLMSTTSMAALTA